MRKDGITILQVVLTVVIMIVLLAIAIFNAPNVAREARLAAVYAEIKEIESVVKELALLNEITVGSDNVMFHVGASAPQIDNSEYPKELYGVSSGTYYYLDFTSSRDLESALGLERIDNDYLLDLENLNIYLVGGADIFDADGNVIIKYNSDDIAKHYENTVAKSK